ncbi:MAG: SPASM domain-containing protein [Magnetococcales bacterium]|nr:SPASM domain-containing protein [Magnetococcales bacterium]
MIPSDNAQLSMRGSLHHAMRKKAVFIDNLLVPSKIWNLLKMFVKYLFRLDAINVYPLMLKIDDTPLCQLKCPVCIHIDHVKNNFSQQDFKNKKMDFGLFKKVVDEVAGKTLVLSFGHLGEPILNKDLAKMVRYARDKNVNSFVTTNFSVKITDEQMEALICSGLKIISIPIDGYTQEIYAKTRVNGNLSLVKKNTERLIEMRNRLGVKDLFIEVQTATFTHNPHEIPLIAEYCKKLGVDYHRVYGGDEGNWIIDCRPFNDPRKPQAIPYCAWPFFASVIIYDGRVLPCSAYHVDNTFSVEEESIHMDNVNNVSFSSVFNSKKYNTLRRLMYNPRADDHNPDVNFCDGCSVINHQPGDK